MNKLLFIISSLFFISCSRSDTARKLSGCDSLVIHFNAPNTDSVVRSVATTEKQAIKKLVGFVDGKATEEFKCGYDGSMVFYEKGNLVSDVSFKYTNPDCRHFLMAADEKLSSTKMSREAADFLQSLSEGRSWY